MDPIQQMQGAQPSEGKAVKMATPEQKKQLMDMIEATKGKLGEFNSASFSVDNQMESSKNDALKEVFATLQAAGVDLTDPASVADFLSKLRIQNPQMSKIFEDALNSLLGIEQSPSDTDQPQEPAPMPDLGQQAGMQPPVAPPMM